LDVISNVFAAERDARGEGELGAEVPWSRLGVEVVSIVA
jgi:hypothetical protein